MHPLTLSVVAAALLAFGPLVIKIIDWLRLLVAGDVSAFVTQGLAFAVGVAVAFLVVHSDFAVGTALFHLNAATTILAGLALGAGGSTIYDFKRAFDNTDNASMPHLIRPRTTARTHSHT